MKILEIFIKNNEKIKINFLKVFKLNKLDIIYKSFLRIYIELKCAYYQKIFKKI